jgi:hydrogenase-4 component B
VTRISLPAVAGVVTVAVGAAGMVGGAAVLRHPLAPTRVGWLLPLAGTQLAADATSGLFLLVAGAVGVATGIYSVGYAAHGTTSRTQLAVLPLFLACMLAVPLAGSVSTFLFLWELMALTSLLGVLAESRRPEARDAGLFYAAMTHLGFLAILLGLVVFAAATGAETFPALRAAAAHLSPGTRDAVYLLTVVGFGAKAGLVPLHAWLPRAHPAAPSPVSALMSTAMVNLGIYGIVRVDLVLLGPGPRWWGLVLFAGGAVTAVHGVLQASVATDLKRLLAYSTIENMGLICLALGAAMLLTASGDAGVAAVAMAAALVHLVCHAAFKSLGFFAAGAVGSATGQRDLDALGGLAPRMPATTIAFGICALGASGLPPGCGFAGEWLLLQSLVHAVPAGGTMIALVMPLAVGVVALTTGLGVAAMVKAFGVGFLARPRGAGAAGAHEAGPTMVVGMGAAAVACGILGVGPGLIAPVLSRVLPELPVGAAGRPPPSLGILLRLPGIGGSVSPTLLAGGVGAGIALALLAARRGARRRPAARTAALWACGGGAPTARMQYTATSFAEPLTRVFDGVLRPDVEFAVTPHAQSPYLVERVSYRSRPRDMVEASLYGPALRAVAAAARAARRAHTGNIHAYLAYGATALLVALLVAQ